jgi:hypothetical protein
LKQWQKILKNVKIKMEDIKSEAEKGIKKYRVILLGTKVEIDGTTQNNKGMKLAAIACYKSEIEARIETLEHIKDDGIGTDCGCCSFVNTEIVHLTSILEYLNQIK